MGNLIFDGKGIIGHDLIVKMKRGIEMLLQGFPPITANGTAKESITALTVYGHSTQDGTPSPENPVPIVSTGDEGEINVSVSNGGTQSQTLTLSTPGGLPGIPVTSGGNYTDADGQQWICDEIDLARGKYVQRNCRLVLDGSEVWGARYNENAQRFFFRYLVELPYKRQSGGILCTAFLNVDWGYNDPDANNSISFASDDVALQVSTTLFDGNVEEFKDWLTTNPMTVVYTIATPIETDLTAEEIAAYKALHTYSPTTTVSNDAAAWMEVGVIME